MTASSQTPPGALPPESASGRRPLPALPGAVPTMAPRALPAATPVEAAAAVIGAAMAAEGGSTARDIAAAEVRAGLVFDPARIQAAVDAAVEQSHAELRAELAERGRQLATMAGTARQLAAVLRLCEGRPGTHHLPVALLAAAAEYGVTPYDAMPPMTLKWNGGVHLHPGAAPRQAVIECETPYGTRADLVVEDADRQALASLVGGPAHDIHQPCPTPGCGTDHDWDPADPDLVGWSRLEVAILGAGPRWYCSPMCVTDALARAGAELAADDQAAATDPTQQAHDPQYGGDPLAYGPTGIRCGCGKAAHSTLTPCQPDTDPTRRERGEGQ